MKKVLLFLVLLLIPCIVLADNEIFVETGTKEANNQIIVVEQYKDGYAIVNQNYREGAMLLEILNKQGEVSKSIDVGFNPYPIQIITNNNQLYLFRFRYDVACTLELYNENLEKQNEITIENCNPLMAADVEIVLNSFAIIKDGYIYYYDEDGTVVKIKSDLSTYERVNMSETEIEELIPGAYYFKKVVDTLPSTSRIIDLDYNNDYIIANIMDIHTCQGGGTVQCYNQVVRLYDKNLNIIKEFTVINETNGKVSPDRQALAVRIIQNYLLVSYISLGKPQVYLPGEDIPNILGSIEVCDFDGNPIQTIEVETYIPIVIRPTNTGFLTNSLRASYSEEDDTDKPRSELVYYSINPPIDVPTIDHGRVIVPSNAIAGETVTIEVKPDKGFTLSELTVLDANGNKLPVTNNTFVMGTSKVTVLASFTPENPNTGNFYVILICLIAAISGIVLVFQKRKLDFLK